MQGDIEKPKENPLGTENIYKLIVKFAVPSIVAMLVSALYNIVDQIFIGQGVGMLGNAATNVAFPLTTISISIALLLGIGGASNFNLRLGEKRTEEAVTIAGNTISFLAIFGILLAIIISLFLRPLLHAFGATELVLPYATTYTRIITIGMPFLIMTNGFCHLIRADGSPKYSMMCMLIGAAFNMIFDPIFIFVFKWGIAGAAWATILGQMLSFIVAALYLRKFKTAPIKKQHLKISGANLLQIARLGIAACFNQLALLVVQITLNNSLRYYGALSQYGSEIPLASTGIIMKVNMIFFSIAIGIAQGCQPINGYNYGAKNYARVAQTLKTALLSATAILSIGFVLFQLFPREIISIFGDGSEEYFIFAERFFRIFLFATFLNGIHPITSNFFTSIGKASRGMLMSLTRQVLFLVPLILILPIFYGIDGIMYAGPIADVAAALLGGYLIRKELKNMKQLEAQEEASNLLQTPIQS